jgi:hypothetical protein
MAIILFLIPASNSIEVALARVFCLHYFCLKKILIIISFAPATNFCFPRASDLFLLLLPPEEPLILFVLKKITRSIGQGVPPDSYFYFYNNKNKKAISQKVTKIRVATQVKENKMLACLRKEG